MNLRWVAIGLAGSGLLWTTLGTSRGRAQESPGKPPVSPAAKAQATDEEAGKAADEEAGKAADAEAGKAAELQRLPDSDVWIDKGQKQVVLVGKVCLREGQLELFACPERSKEHESVVSVRTKAFVVHAALLAVGAKPGHPAVFTPKYDAAAGQEIDVWVFWTDEQGKSQRVRAQEWIREVRTGEAMRHAWVFAGSRFWRDEVTGKERYMAEDGDLICVSNFSSAMLDLPVQSSDQASGLLFEAFTAQIPPRDTQVILVLVPRLPPDEDSADSKGDDTKAEPVPPPEAAAS